MTFWQYLSSDMASILIWTIFTVWSLVQAGYFAYRKMWVLARYEVLLAIVMFMFVWRVLATYQPLVTG